MIFVLLLLAVLGTCAAYLFLTSKGIGLDNLVFLKQTRKRPDGGNDYPGNIILESKVFLNEGTVPEKYTCKGTDVSPPLQISNVPKETKSLALVVEDPDAPYKTWTHWIAYNISPKVTQIGENVVPWGTELGENDFGVAQYRGPCPPSGQHRYVFRVYALDTILNLEKGANIDQFKEGIKGHILDIGELTGVFEKK